MSDLANLGELYAALAAARAEFGALTKGKIAQIRSDKGNYSYTYADLSDIIEATAAALAKHGLVIIQEPEVAIEAGKPTVIIHGCIAHKSGAVHLLRPLPMPAAMNTAQSIGSAISYGRRYQQQAALNLAADDDDGQAASQMPIKSAQNAPQRPQGGTIPNGTAKAPAAPPEPPAPATEAIGLAAEEEFMGEKAQAPASDYDPEAPGWSAKWKTEKHYPFAQDWGRQIGKWKDGPNGGHFQNAWSGLFKKHEAHKPENAQAFLAAWRRCVIDHLPKAQQAEEVAP